MVTLLLSTYQRLLQVELGLGHCLRSVKTIAHGHGIYFGLTRGRRKLFAVARNLDANMRILDPRAPTNAIEVYEWPLRRRRPKRLSVAGAAGLHQIRYRSGLLWIVNGQPPELLAVEPVHGLVMGRVALSEFVPAELRHPAPAHHPHDPYHFNSLHFAQSRLFILAHNWTWGSFVLEFAFTGAARFLQTPRLLRVYGDVGQLSHDICFDSDRLLVLDSMGGQLVSSDGRQTSLAPPGGQRGFPRGLAVGRRFIYIAQGLFETQHAQRMDGTTWLAVLDRSTLQQVASFELGSYGSTCEVLLVKEAHWNGR